MVEYIFDAKFCQLIRIFFFIILLILEISRSILPSDVIVHDNLGNTILGIMETKERQLY